MVVLYEALLAVVGVALVKIHWAWLSQSQNGGGLQAAAAIVVGIPTLLFAGLATLAASESAASSAKQSIAADRQAEAAVAQAKAAHEQIRLTEFQYQEQQRQAAVQRSIDDAREVAAYHRLVAEDEATRPRFTISSSFSRSNQASVEIKNIGGGDALNMMIASPNANSSKIHLPILREGTGFRCKLDLIDMELQEAICTFTSRMGSRWVVQLRMQDNLMESLVNVDRPYDTRISTLNERGDMERASTR